MREPALAYNFSMSDSIRSPVHTIKRRDSGAQAFASQRTVSAAIEVSERMKRYCTISCLPLVWQSWLKNGGSHMMRSKEPLSSAGSFTGCWKSYCTNSLNTAKRSSNSSKVRCGRQLYSSEDYLLVKKYVPCSDSVHILASSSTG